MALPMRSDRRILGHEPAGLFRMNLRLLAWSRAVARWKRPPRAAARRAVDRRDLTRLFGLAINSSSAHNSPTLKSRPPKGFAAGAALLAGRDGSKL
jgi:hypothetical protein